MCWLLLVRCLFACLLVISCAFVSCMLSVSLLCGCWSPGPEPTPGAAEDRTARTDV